MRNLGQYILKAFSSAIRRWTAVVVIGLVLAPLATGTASAQFNPIPIPGPQSNSYGLEATKTKDAPKNPPTITSPGGGTSASGLITVGGTCENELLVQIYNNGVMVGAIECKNGSFSIQISLFTGTNDINAVQFDELGQASPVSNMVTMFFNNASITAFGNTITLTSNYGRRAANPNTVLTWPLILSGGTGPYAFSIDWGDGTSPELKSLALTGAFDINHTYKQAGLYHVTVKVTDVNGVSAFLQLVAIANGKASPTPAADENKTTTKVVNKVLWLPMVVLFILLLPTYWIGRRSMIVSLRKKLEKDMETFKEL